MSSPAVSVCIPVYNGKQFIEETINSVLAQTYENFTIHILDNQSNDGTWELLNTIATRDARIRVSRNATNVGMAGNWNLILENIVDPLVMLLSADDLLMPTFLETATRAMSRQDVDVVATDYTLLVYGHARARRTNVAAGLYKDHADTVLLRNPFSINFMLFRSSALQSLKSFGKLFGHYQVCDYSLHLRIALSGRRLAYIREPLGVYRVHESALSRLVKKFNRQTALVVLGLRERLSDRNTFVYKLTLARFLFRAVVRGLRGQYFDKRLIKLLFRRIV